MKTYQCYKRVKAAQIVGIDVTTEDQGSQLMNVTDDGQVLSAGELLMLHRPEYTPAVGDYIVEYDDGYRSISPQATFENGYLAIEPGSVSLTVVEASGEMSFGTAVVLLKGGRRVTRSGWGSKAVYLELQVPDENSKMTLPYIYFTNHEPQSQMPAIRVPWTPAPSDLLATDWAIAGDDE